MCLTLTVVEVPGTSWKARVRFGGTDATALLLNFKTNQSISELASAEVVIRLDPSFPEPVELFSEVKFSVVDEAGREQDLFTGDVVEAVPNEGAVHMRLQAATFLKERNVPPWCGHQVGAAEWIYTILRDSGHPEERMQIDGLDALAEEPMLVAVPILGLEVQERVAIGAVTFVPRGEAVRPYADRHVLDLVYEPLIDTSVHAVYTTSARLLRDAEGEALHAVEVVLAYLQLTGHYGLLLRPSGRPHHFTRDSAHVQPRRGEVVAVEGLSTGRCWVRVPEDRTPPLELAVSAAESPEFARELTLAERQALIAWRRAASERDTVAAATALSDALEFYASGVAADPLFLEDDLNALLQGLPNLAPHKDKIIRDTIRRLNAAPLKSRLLEAVRRDGTPLSRSEVDFLWQRVRGARNKAVHGKGIDPPTPQELQLALSLVARLLTHRIEGKHRPEEEILAADS
jgi:hypothetical protein